MADRVTTEPKHSPISHPLPSPAHSSSSQEDGLPTPPELEYHPRPTGFRGIFTNTHTQVVFLGFVCFMCPGLFNALNGLGGSGQLDQRTSANANSALYATFAVAAFFAG